MNTIERAGALVEAIATEMTAGAHLEECESPDGGPYLPLTFHDDPGTSAGQVRLWRGPPDTPVDRMVQMQLLAGPVETQLLFVFGDADSCMPHFHVQTVQFPPDGCVYNVDILPRLDPVTQPDWFTRVYSGLRRPYRLATGEAHRSCARAPANPALAFYMSPYGIASGRTTLAELTEVAAQIRAYAEHYLELSKNHWPPPEGVDTAERDAQYLRLFFADELDPRAWHGVYKVIGDARGALIKGLLKTPLKNKVKD